jgi:hypothetical protein
MLIGSYSPLFDICNSINLDKYTITYTNHIGVDTDSSLLEEALNYLPQCELFDDYAMEPVYASKNSHCGHIRRIKPSSCAGCNGHHSNDNTLRVYLFNGMAFAKCTRGGRSYPLCGAKPDIVIEQDESVDDRTNEEYIDDLNDQRNDILAEIEYAQADMDTERIEELELELNEIDRLIKLALW